MTSALKGDEHARFAWRVAVVTGAAGGIGRGMAETFAAPGMKLVLADEPTGVRDQSGGRRAGEAADHAGITNPIGQL
jgi:NAD(P)-dependent dehydrogenase (short-subunit alcohol dehydrogenase family)